MVATASAMEDTSGTCIIKMTVAKVVNANENTTRVVPERPQRLPRDITSPVTHPETTRGAGTRHGIVGKYVLSRQ